MNSPGKTTSGISKSRLRPPGARAESPKNKNQESLTPSPLDQPAVQEPLVVSAALLRTLGKKLSH